MQSGTAIFQDAGYISDSDLKYCSILGMMRADSQWEKVPIMNSVLPKMDLIRIGFMK